VRYAEAALLHMFRISLPTWQISSKSWG